MMPDPSRWLNDRFEGWRRLTPSEKKAVRDFPVLWAHFELYATNARASPVRIINAVNNLLEVPNLPAVTAANNYFADRYFDDGHQTDHYRHLRLSDITQQIVHPVLLGHNLGNSEALKSALLITNRFRNNFLHGEKAKYGFYDQLQNFQHANAVLMVSIPLWLE
jgi:hypothetical protein